MALSPVISGFLYQLGKSNSNMWKKRYFVLLPDGTLSIADKKGSSPKQFFYLSNESDISSIPSEELKGEAGFYINVSAYQLVCVKSGKKSDIVHWDRAIKGLLKNFSAHAKKKVRLTVSDIYAQMASIDRSRDAKQSKISGYNMKVGRNRDAIDYFVNANTFEYFISEDDCRRGKKPVGKAQLQLLV